MLDNNHTHFAPAERAPLYAIMEQSRVLEKLKAVKNCFDAMPGITMILNKQRQLVFCNKALLEFLGIADISMILGMRPGEILRCIHADSNPGGCGTGESCSVCGALESIMASQAGGMEYRECRITRKTGDSFECLDLGISASPFKIEGEDFTIMSVTDISHEKRRKALEKVFFHDIMNTMGVLFGTAELLTDIKDPDLSRDFINEIKSTAGLLIEEIKEQRDLMEAENNELTVSNQLIQARSLLEEVVKLYSGRHLVADLKIRICNSPENITFISDPVILRRVLGNMLKNAVEASKPGDTITLGVRVADDQVEFRVNNPSVMPVKSRLQVFQRSFSTKGANRGLGTYSMKLLTERYLKGKVFFTVSEEEGTTFFASYPLDCRGLSEPAANFA